MERKKYSSKYINCCKYSFYWPTKGGTCLRDCRFEAWSSSNGCTFIAVRSSRHQESEWIVLFGAQRELRFQIDLSGSWKELHNWARESPCIPDNVKVHRWWARLEFRDRTCSRHNWWYRHSLTFLHRKHDRSRWNVDKLWRITQSCLAPVARAQRLLEPRFPLLENSPLASSR